MSRSDSRELRPSRLMISGPWEISLIEHWNGKQWLPALTPQLQHGTWTTITALSAHDIWIIGQANGAPQALHWDGKTWTFTPMPTLPSSIVTLAGIAAITPDNAWIVGSSRSGNYPNYTNQPLMLHWDGTSWHEVAGATPRPAARHSLGVSQPFQQRTSGLSATL